MAAASAAQHGRTDDGYHIQRRHPESRSHTMAEHVDRDREHLELERSRQVELHMGPERRRRPHAEQGRVPGQHVETPDRYQGIVADWSPVLEATANRCDDDRQTCGHHRDQEQAIVEMCGRPLRGSTPRVDGVLLDGLLIR